VRERPEVHDGRAAVRRAPHRGEIQEIVAVGAVETGYLVASALQMVNDMVAYIATVPRDQNPHRSMMTDYQAVITDLPGRRWLRLESAGTHGVKRAGIGR
jgi:hypothetical protein